jgi:hypothetical protein
MTDFFLLYFFEPNVCHILASSSAAFQSKNQRSQLKTLLKKEIDCIYGEQAMKMA